MGLVTGEQAGSSISTPAPSKFTPGPWQSEQPREEKPITIFSVILGEPCVVEPVASVYTKANARLITASPDMLEALQAILPHLEPSNVSLSIARSRADELREAADRADQHDEAVRKVRRAIRKATHLEERQSTEGQGGSVDGSSP